MAKPSKNEYGTPLLYSNRPHVDGYISKYSQNFILKGR